MKRRSGCGPGVLGPLSLWLLGLFTTVVVGLLPNVGWWVVALYLVVTCLLVGARFLWVGLRRRYSLPEPGMQARANRLCAAAKEALRHAPISPDRRASIREQVVAVPANMKASRGKLKRLQNLQNLTIEHRGKRGRGIGPDGAKHPQHNERSARPSARCSEVADAGGDGQRRAAGGGHPGCAKRNQ